MCRLLGVSIFENIYPDRLALNFAVRPADDDDDCPCTSICNCSCMFEFVIVSVFVIFLVKVLLPDMVAQAMGAGKQE